MYLNNVTSTDFVNGDAETRTRSPIDSVLRGDCIDVMRRLDAASVDFILTDPPYLADYRSRDAGRYATTQMTTGSSLPFPSIAVQDRSAEDRRSLKPGSL